MSDRSDPQVRLPRAAEALLERWAVPEKDERAWEESAEAILTRVEMARVGSTDSALLAAPLPSELGEGSIGSPRSVPRAVAAPEPAAAPVSLAELARAALAEDASNDAADIARESLAIASRARTSSPRISSPQLTEAPRHEASPAPPPAVAAPAVAAAPVVALQPARERRAKRSFAGPLLAATFVVIGMAAAAVIVIRHQQGASPVAALPTPAPDRAHEPAAAPPAAEAKADLEIVSPESLPATAKPTEPAPKAGAAPPPAGKAGAVAPTEVAAKAPAPAEAPKPEQPVDDKEAAKMKPAAQPTDVPQQPSNGAAQAAVAQVIGSARACVAGHEEASRATIVFGSDGRVQSVSVSGPAAGTPAESCIRSALGRARVEPFAKPTFSVGTAIRP